MEHPPKKTEIDTIWAHDEDIRRVLEEMRQTKLVADINKCDFFVERSNFVGTSWGRGKEDPHLGNSWQ